MWILVQVVVIKDTQKFDGMRPVRSAALTVQTPALQIMF